MAEIRPFEITTSIENSPSGIQKLSRQIAKVASDLFFVLRSLSIEDNFKRYIWVGTIPASSEIKIKHDLKKVPTGFLVLKDTSGALRMGPTPWTATEAYIENAAMLTDSEAKIAILG